MLTRSSRRLRRLFPQPRAPEVLPTFELSEAEYAYVLAERNAVALLAYSSCEVPAENARLRGLLSTRLVEDAITFALHARRFLDATGFKPEIRQVLVNRRISVGPAFETSLRRAVSGIVHSTYLNVIFDQSLFAGFQIGKTECPPILSCETDVYPRFLIDVYGMAWSLLGLEGEFLKMRAETESRN